MASEPIHPVVDGLPKPARDRFFEYLAKRARASAAGGNAGSSPADKSLVSTAQARLWFLQQLAPESAAYGNPCALSIRGPLDCDVLDRVLCEIVRRHEVLRTRFISVDGIPQARVDAPFRIEAVRRDMPDREAALQWIDAERQRSFDLATGPLIRVGILRLAPADHILFLNFHHIVCDSWSHRVLWGEIAALYPPFLEGAPSPIPDPPLQYSDYARWSAEKSASHAVARQWEYWRGQLADPPRPLSFGSAPQSASPPAGTYRWTFPPGLIASVRSLARERGIAFSAALLAALALLLREETGVSDVAVALSVSDRGLPAMEKLLGLMVNVLPIRLNTAGKGHPLELLDDAQGRWLEALANRDIPFDELVARLRPAGRDEVFPLLQVGLVVDDRPGPALRMGGLEIEPLDVEAPGAKLDLILYVAERNGEFGAQIEYNADLFTRARTKNLAERFCGLLQQLASGAHDHAHTNLTEAQVQMWLDEQIHPEAVYDNSVMTFRIEGALDTDRFRRAFNLTVEGTDALRTVIEGERGLPVSRVLPHRELPTEILDLTSYPDPETEWRQWLDSRRRRKLASPESLVDSVLVLIGPRTTVWYLNLHHLLTDAWSTSLIFKRTAEFYRGLASGEPVASRSFPSFRAYAEIEAQSRQSPEAKDAAEYWAAKLSDAPAALTLYGIEASDPESPAVRHMVELRAEQLAWFPDRICNDWQGIHGVQTFATAFAAFLYRISGANRMIIGMPVHSRSKPALRDIVGLCIRVIPLCIEVSDGDTFASLESNVREVLFESLRHQPYSMAATPGRRPYIAVLNYQTATFSDFAGLPVTADWIQPGQSRECFALQVEDFNGTGRPRLLFDFRGDVFSRDQQRRAIAQFMRILDAYRADALTPINDVDIVSGSERDELERLLDGGPPIAETAGMVDRIAEHGRVPAEHTAVVCGGETLSYSELDARADRIARALNEDGVRPGDLVGLVLPLCAALLPSILGVLKTGAAYFPLHYADPVERIRSALREARVAAVLSRGAMLQELAGFPAPLRNADDEPDAASLQPTLGARPKTGGAWIYAIHTSGSTGVPKCAAVRHESFANLVGWCIREFGYTADDRTLVVTSPSFDLTQKNFFAPLVTGGVVVLAPSYRFDAEETLSVIESQGVTLLNCPPAMFSAILEAAARGQYRALSSLRWVILGGEPLRSAPLRAWLRTTGGRTRIANEYGPCECTDVGTWYVASPREVEATEELPIGRAIAGARLEVCDPSGRCTPWGATGELYIGGVVTGDGYVNNATSTADRFRPDPREPGARRYATGDRVWVDRDGLLRYAGRMDHQVKVRGRRVELGEVSAALQRHRRIASTVIIQRAPGEPLVAYFEKKDDASPTPAELAAFLRRSLPDAMIPAAFVAMERLPLNARGKIHKAALPPPKAADYPAAGSSAAPLSPREVAIAAVWAGLLNRDPATIGRHDRFFDIGGHSLLAARLVARICDVFPPGISLRQFFEEPTVAGVAARLGNPADRPMPLRIKPGTPHPLSFPQLSLWLAEQFGRAPNVTFAWEIEGELQRSALQQALSRLVERHASLRTTFRMVEGVPAQVVERSADLVVEQFDLGADGRSQALSQVQTESTLRFDMAAAPLARAKLLSMGPERAVFVLTLHHIIADAVTLSTIFRELAECYGALTAGRQPALPPLTLTYADFAVWQRKSASEPVIERQLRYWQDRLRAPRPRLSFPGGDSSHSAPAIRHSFEIRASELQALRDIGVRAGATLFTTLLAAFECLLWHATRVTDIIVGVDFDGRTHPDLRAIAGFFVNQVVLRTDLSGDPTFREVVRRCGQCLMEAQQNQDAAFEQVRGRVNGSAPAGAGSELFQAKFIFQEEPDTVMQMPSLRISPFGDSMGPARFPVLLSVKRHSECAVATLHCDPAAMSGSYGALLAAGCEALFQTAAAEPDLALSVLRERLNRLRIRRGVAAGERAV